MPWDLNSCLYHLTCGKIGFVYVILLKVAEPVNSINWGLTVFLSGSSGDWLVCFQICSSCQNLVPCGYRAEDIISFIAVNQESFSASWVCLHSLVHGPLPLTSKPAKAHHVLLVFAIYCPLLSHLFSLPYLSDLLICSLLLLRAHIISLDSPR